MLTGVLGGVVDFLTSTLGTVLSSGAVAAIGVYLAKFAIDSYIDDLDDHREFRERIISEHAEQSAD